MKGSAQDLVDATFESVNDAMIKSAKRYSEIMRNQGSDIIADDDTTAELNGVWEMDREGNSRFALSASAPIPVSGIPVNTDIDAGLGKEFHAVSAVRVKLLRHSHVTVQRIKEE